MLPSRTVDPTDVGLVFSMEEDPGERGRRTCPQPAQPYFEASERQPTPLPPLGDLQGRTAPIYLPTGLMYYSKLERTQKEEINQLAEQMQTTYLSKRDPPVVRRTAEGRSISTSWHTSMPRPRDFGGPPASL